MLRWGIIGTGTIATEWASQFEVEDAQLVAVLSRSAEKGIAFQRKYQLENTYTTLEEFLADETIDVVYIATPHNTHYYYMMKALQAKKHVVAEKSITLNRAQLKTAQALAEQQGVYLFEAMTIHYMPLYQRIHEWIQSKNLGPLKMIQVSFGSFKTEDPSRYFFNKELAGGALLDIGVYALHFVRWFLSSQPHEMATFGVFHSTGVDESSTIMLKNKENELASVSLTFRSKMPKRGIVAYEKGYITIEEYPRSNRAVLTYTDGQTEELVVGNSALGLQVEVATITHLIQQNIGNPYLQNSLDVLELMDFARKEWGLTYDAEGTD